MLNYNQRKQEGGGAERNKENYNEQQIEKL